MGNRTSLAYVTNIPGPYRSEMIEAWAAQNGDLEISVYYTDADDQGRGWITRPARGVSEVRLRTMASLGRYGKLNWGVVRLVLRSDVVMIGGLEQGTYLLAALVARLAGRGPILLFDGFSPKRFGRERRVILAVKRITAWLCRAYFANGSVGRMYLRGQLGVSPEKPFFNQCLSHADQFHEQLLAETAGSSKLTRQHAAGFCSGQRIVMCCGYLIYRKRIDLIIDALALLPESSRPTLLVVGAGPLMEELKTRAASARVPSVFTGHKDGLELAAHYYLADVFVLASDDDPWGLVVNEAMRAGLPVVVSDACGASLDLVQSGINGFVFESGSSEALRAALARVLESDREAMGAVSQALISRWNAGVSARNLGECVRTVSR